MCLAKNYQIQHRYSYMSQVEICMVWNAKPVNIRIQLPNIAAAQVAACCSSASTWSGTNWIKGVPWLDCTLTHLEFQVTYGTVGSCLLVLSSTASCCMLFQLLDLQSLPTHYSLHAVYHYLQRKWFWAEWTGGARGDWPRRWVRGFDFFVTVARLECFLLVGSLFCSCFEVWRGRLLALNFEAFFCSKEGLKIGRISHIIHPKNITRLCIYVT